MNIQEVKGEEMYCLFAPDGSFQSNTLSPDFPSCVAFIKIMHKKGIGRSFHELCVAGYRVMPVKVTVVVNGDENKPF
ncbi:hypothetical protein [Runella slithyformis]|uniref:Uncharacterized protein n=1 Tax=Runella slithyformis (strain ATCC 29530 / DSM 19594 / LMG 11500 / NCIMB 11436 / LSU 4) TaxID=761193 RepID=A0A7U4E4L7_RUNSL|nr:hypothetical protein [Runella slithyformis]AEI47651.1 hypothetical protein Runsl_1223 [Runella slithyformis DSM 19594]